MGCWFRFYSKTSRLLRFYCDKVCFKKPAALETHGPDPALVVGGGGGGGGGGAAAAAASLPVEAAAKHECPICCDNADDATVDGVGYAQCCECGQLVCGACKAECMAVGTTCPNSRAPFDVSAEEQVAQLLRLVRRAPGRYTP
jgi:hypothetical protein